AVLDPRPHRDPARLAFGPASPHVRRRRTGGLALRGGRRSSSHRAHRKLLDRVPGSRRQPRLLADPDRDRVRAETVATRRATVFVTLAPPRTDAEAAGRWRAWLQLG